MGLAGTWKRRGALTPFGGPVDDVHVDLVCSGLATPGGAVTRSRPALVRLLHRLAGRSGRSFHGGPVLGAQRQ